MKRFAFGKNWTSYSRNALSASRITQAREAFFRLVPAEQLRARRFLDVGFGQGLALLFAAEAGAEAVGIDIDPENLTALEIAKRQTGISATRKACIISILDETAIAELTRGGLFDVVYSWGVLHHTGAMWPAIDATSRLVAPGGTLVIALYRTHWSSPAWKLIKRAYVNSPQLLQRGFLALLYPIIYLAKFLVTGRNPKGKERGMDFYHDVIDWVGGYPYEHATKSEVVRALEASGFNLSSYHPASTPTGCDEYVFNRRDGALKAPVVALS